MRIPAPRLPEEGDDDMTPVEAYLDCISRDGLVDVHAAVHDLDLETLRRDPGFARAEKAALAKFVISSSLAKRNSPRISR